MLKRVGYRNPFGEAHRSQFPVTSRLIYLNHAAVAPLAKPAADAMSWLAADACEFGSFHYGKWLDAYEQLRVQTARMIGAQRDEIAIVKNTSEGIATVALGIDWRAGDKLVCFREEFPANYYPWQRLEPRGVRIEWLSIEDPPERIEAAARGARLLAVSFVNYLSGHRVDLDVIGEICHRHGVFFFVDAIQGLGAFPLDVERSRIDALSADGHKWLLGPEGCGVLYVRRGRLEEIEPVEFGWTNAASYADYASRDMTLRPDAGRYECGTLNTIGIFGLLASIRYLNEAGIGQVAESVLGLTRHLVEGAQSKGYEVLGKRGPSASGIVSIRHPETDSREVVKRLRDAGIITAPRQGWVRTSPHFYITHGEIDRMLDLL
ncbi:MAG: aminotransferase class V-fold PLP-dependent enzyme [Acidobacteria bacterium]|nr:aminotransferase class V-fold PLP-dependent enzyme [Acidobacteriota bacterium]